MAKACASTAPYAWRHADHAERFLRNRGELADLAVGKRELRDGKISALELFEKGTGAAERILVRVRPDLGCPHALRPAARTPFGERLQRLLGKRALTRE